MAEPGLRIAMLTHSVNPRGGVVHALELAEALQRAGHAVTLMAPAAPGQRLFRATRCALELAPLPPPAGPGLVDTVRARIAAYVDHLGTLLRHAPQGRFQVFHAHDSISGNALATLQQHGLIGGFVRTVHHLDEFDDPQLAAWQQRAFMAAAQVLCVSQLWCDTLQRRHGVAAALVHNGVDRARYQPQPQPGDAQVAQRYGLRPGGPLVLAVGGVEERKNTVRLLQAFVQLRQASPQAQLVIAGGASLLDHGAYAADFRAVAAAGGLQPAVGGALVLTGPVDDADMPALYRLADVLAMPSLREGFGLAVLEALASGTPAVASRRAPFTEFLGRHDVCWADPLDVPSIAQALAQAAAQPRFAPPAVCRRFNWDDSAARHAALYRDVMHRAAALVP
jgi:glycosyltransferase-like protein